MQWKRVNKSVCVGDPCSWGQSCLPDCSCRRVVHSIGLDPPGLEGVCLLLGHKATGKFKSFVSRITQCFLHKWDYHLWFSPSCDWAFPISSESNYGSESNAAFRINPSVMASKSGFSWPAMHGNIPCHIHLAVGFTQLLNTQE